MQWGRPIVVRMEVVMVVLMMVIKVVVVVAGDVMTLLYVQGLYAGVETKSVRVGLLVTPTKFSNIRGYLQSRAC
jgi:hypothetical protein